MNATDTKRIVELHNILEGSSIYAFSCSLCVLVARPADCQGCPVYKQSVTNK